VWQQYDSLVQHNTLAGPGGDAALVRVEGTSHALALSTDGNGRYCLLDPRTGAGLAVAEAARNVACTGARPVAVTNCLNFGSPENPEAMWQFVEAVAGMGEACRALGTPVTGGNVSFYNEFDGQPINPTPIVGMLGILEDSSKRAGIAWRPGETVVLLGETRAELGGSEWAWIAHGFTGGAPPALDLDAERRLIDLLVDQIERGVIASAHDCSDGGLAVTLAECAIAGGIGATIDAETDLPPHAWLFGESSARAVVTTREQAGLIAAAEAAGVPATVLGETGGAALEIPRRLSVSVADLRDAYEEELARILGG
jgi:phosphoribosylformylglycinamidine synthase